MSRECLKSLSPWFWISRNFLLEMGGGVQTARVRTQSGGGSEHQAYVCVRGGREGQILANLERTY